MSEKQNQEDRTRAANSTALKPYLRRYLANVNDNVSWSSSSDSQSSESSSSEA